METYRSYWTKQELLIFLPNRAASLENNLSSNYNVYDGLVVMISCHGISNKGSECIITSDYGLIEKESIAFIGYLVQRMLKQDVSPEFLYLIVVQVKMNVI